MRYVWDGSTWVPAAEAPPARPSGKAGWPMRSLALGVDPRQARAATARARKHGVAVTYCPRTGDAIIPSAGERRKLMRLEQAFDKHAFL